MSTETMNEMSLNVGRTFVWHECYVPDASKALDFYTKALGFTSKEMDMGPMGTYKMLERNGQAVCGVVSTDSAEMAGVPPHWATYLSVDDVDQSLATCQEHGAKIVVPPM